MLSPDYLKNCTEDIVRLYQRLEDDIIWDMARRIAKTDFTVPEGARRQMERLKQAGGTYDDVIKGLSKYTRLSQREVEKLLEDAAGKSLEYDDRIYRKAGLHPPPAMESPFVSQHIAAAAKKTGGVLTNLTMTTANTTQTAFINACDRAYMQVQSGGLDYVSAVKRAVKTVSRSGVTVLYPTGHSDKIDVAVRRAVLTGVSQTTGQLQIMRMDEMDCDLVETTAHFGARPSHTAWQGCVFSRSGAHPKYPDFVRSTGYGSGEGLCGWNCRHSFFPFFEGLSQRAYTDEQLRERENRTVEYNGNAYTYYDASQMQRRMERVIREDKRELIGIDAAASASNDMALCDAMKAEFTSASVTLKAHEAELKDFLEQTGRENEKARQQVLGFGRSQAQKAVWANKKELEKYSKLRYNKDGIMIVTDDWKGKDHPRIPKVYKPNAVIETASANGVHMQVDRSIYDNDGKLKKQIHSGAHGNKNTHPYGKCGEHKHEYSWMDGEKSPRRTTAALTEQERKEHGDII